MLSIMPDPSGYPTDRMLDALLLALDEGVLLYDASGTCRAATAGPPRSSASTPATLIGHSRRDLLARAAAAVEAPDTSRLSPSPVPTASARSSTPSPSCGRAPARWCGPACPSPKAGRLDLIRDVTRERRAEAAAEALTRRLEMESTLDDLTGLANVKRFEEECLREHRRAQREWISYAVARVDVDGMAGINRASVTRPATSCSKRIGDELKSSRREYDIVARWKDDEFVILLPRADLRALSRVLRRALDQVHAGARELVPGVTVCVGAAVWTPPSAEGPADILRRAGAALAAARAKGPGTVEADLGVGGWHGDEA